MFCCRDFTENHSWDSYHRYNATQATFLRQRQARVPSWAYEDCSNQDTPQELDKGFVCAETLSDKSSTLGAVSIVLIIVGQHCAFYLRGCLLP